MFGKECLLDSSKDHSQNVSPTHWTALTQKSLNASINSHKKYLPSSKEIVGDSQSLSKDHLRLFIKTVSLSGNEIQLFKNENTFQILTSNIVTLTIHSIINHYFLFEIYCTSHFHISPVLGSHLWLHLLWPELISLSCVVCDRFTPPPCPIITS